MVFWPVMIKGHVLKNQTTLGLSMHGNFLTKNEWQKIHPTENDALEHVSLSKLAILGIYVEFQGCIHPKNGRVNTERGKMTRIIGCNLVGISQVVR